ncbi:hypothetical protein AAMO2058_001277600 [Amorphochlora amoebiformis]
MDLDLEGFAFVSIAGALGASAAYTIGRTWNTKVKLVAVAGGAAIGGVWYYLNNNTNQREHDEKDFHELETLEKLVPVEQADHLDNTLHWVRNETQLRHTSCEKLMELFNAKDNIIKKEDFVSKFNLLVISSEAKHNKCLVQKLAEKIFKAFDSNDDGVVNKKELLTGLSVLMGGNGQRKLEMAWSLFDMDNDGHISMEEMVTYFTSYFKVMAELDPNFSKKFKYTAGNLVPIEEIAKHTAMNCFEFADKDHDGEISFEEFKLWFSKPATPSGTGFDGAHRAGY